MSIGTDSGSKYSAFYGNEVRIHLRKTIIIIPELQGNYIRRQSDK